MLLRDGQSWLLPYWSFCLCLFLPLYLQSSTANVIFLSLTHSLPFPLIHLSTHFLYFFPETLSTSFLPQFFPDSSPLVSLSSTLCSSLLQPPASPSSKVKQLRGRMLDSQGAFNTWTLLCLFFPCFFSEAIPETNTCFTLSCFFNGSLPTGIKSSASTRKCTRTQIQKLEKSSWCPCIM